MERFVVALLADTAEIVNWAIDENEIVSACNTSDDVLLNWMLIGRIDPATRIEAGLHLSAWRCLNAQPNFATLRCYLPN